MSSIKSTHIDGDASISRNVAIGGRVTVQGQSYFKGNVKIDGWLDAQNIKGPAKGIFTSIEKLKSAYPCPRTGWWALVGTSLPAHMYIAEGGEWIPTGHDGGEITIESPFSGIGYISVELNSDYTIAANSIPHAEIIYYITIGKVLYNVTAEDPVLWINGIPPAVEPDSILVISVINNLAVWGTFK